MNNRLRRDLIRDKSRYSFGDIKNCQCQLSRFKRRFSGNPSDKLTSTTKRRLKLLGARLAERFLRNLMVR